MKLLLGVNFHTSSWADSSDIGLLGNRPVYLIEFTIKIENAGLIWFIQCYGKEGGVKNTSKQGKG